MPRLSVLCWVMGLGLSVGATARADDPTSAASKPPAASGGKSTKPAKAKAKPAGDAQAAAKPAKPKKSKAVAAPEATQTAAVAATPAAPPVAPVVAPAQPVKPQPAAAPGTACSLEEAELPRGGRLDVLGSGFGPSPVVRIAQKPARMIERRTDRLSVQVPADSDGGQITLQNEGRTAVCGTLVIIGKNR